MTTNYDKAHDLILMSISPDWSADSAANDAADRLADRNLLMPDLPTPEMDDDRLVWRVDEDGFVYINHHGEIATVGVSHPYKSPGIAHRHALALIAAAHHLEREQGNGRD